MSNSLTYFKNDNLRQLLKSLKTKHHSTLPYAPWSNKAVERLGKELLCSSRVLLSELKLPINSWPDLILLMQRSPNHSPSPQRKHLSQMEIFTGRQPKTPMNRFLQSTDATSNSISELQITQDLNLTNLQKAYGFAPSRRRLHSPVQQTSCTWMTISRWTPELHRRWLSTCFQPRFFRRRKALPSMVWSSTNHEIFEWLRLPDRRPPQWYSVYSIWLPTQALHW